MKQAVSNKTKSVLLRVIKYLGKEKTRLEMSTWGQFLPEASEYVSGISDMQPVPPCKTTSCIGGTCLLVSKAGMDYLKQAGCIKKHATYDSVVFPSGTQNKAIQILGITQEQADRLFFFKGWLQNKQGWPGKYATRYKKAKSAEGRFLATKDRIMHFIKTGE